MKARTINNHSGTTAYADIVLCKLRYILVIALEGMHDVSLDTLPFPSNCG